MAKRAQFEEVIKITAIGAQIPDQEVILQDGSRTSLKQLSQGKTLVVYFYPRDNTPGCTAEACSIRDSFSRIKELANIVGVSADSPASHVKFIDKYTLPFPLISDPNLALTKTFGAFGKKKTGGMGLLRSTFVIDPNLKVEAIFGLQGFPKVTTAIHAEEILGSLK